MNSLSIPKLDGLKLKPLLIRANRGLAWVVVAIPVLGWAVHWPWLESTLAAIAMAMLHGLVSMLLLPIPVRVRANMWRWSFLAFGSADGASRASRWTVRERFWWQSLRTALAYLWPWVSVLLVLGFDVRPSGPVGWLVVFVTVNLAWVWMLALPFVAGIHLSSAAQAAFARWGPTRASLRDGWRAWLARLLVTAYFVAILGHFFNDLVPGSIR